MPQSLPDIVIRASAGTGKTYQLASRFLRLLDANVPPESILAATFTRKAAGEILERILLTLARAASDDGERLLKLSQDADPFLRHSFGEMYVVNTRKLGKTWFVDDKLRFEAEPANSRTLKETLQGQLTVKVKDVVTDFARMYGIS